MPKFKIAIIAALAAIVFFQVANYAKKYYGKGNPAGPSQSATQSQKQKLPAGFEARTNSEGPVSVQVTPVELGQDKWNFEIILNTHSVELDYDLAKLAGLIDASGKENLPLSWEGDPPEGHHREGTLVFEAINPKPTSITLKVKEVGGIKERNFVWTIAP